jgi:peptidyl-prolyl cis-trans isomerase C
MLRRLAFIGLALLAVSACSRGSSSKKSGTVLAKGDGFSVTSDDFKAKLDEQSPFMRARYNTLERKKEFLDNLVRFEVLSREAEKSGLRDDPEVQQTLRKIMVQKLVQKRFSDPGSASVPDADVQKYYDDHSAEFHRPKRVRASVIVLQAKAGTPERAKKLAEAKKALALLQAAPTAPEAKKPEPPKPLSTARAAAAKPAASEPVKPGDPQAFGKLVAQLSDDASKSAASPGDIGLKTAEELEKAYSKELATAVFGMKQGEVSGIVETPEALTIAKVTLVQEEVNRTLEQVKPQIVARLSREQKSKEFDEWVKKLKDSASVKVDEAALDALDLATPAPGMSAPGQPGAMPPGHPMTATPGASPAMTPAGKAGGDVKPAGATPAPATQN